MKAMRAMRAPAHLLRSRLQKLLENALDSLYKTENRPPLRIEALEEEKFGHYTCNSAMDRRFRELYGSFDKQYRQPHKFAAAIVAALKKEPEAKELFESIEVAGPGFINLRLRCKVFLEYLGQALQEGAYFGKNRKENPRRIIFEYVSANPTGPLNVVSARAAALGDCCANLLQAIGDEVLREYYVNDYGNQVTLLGQSALLRWLELRGCKLKYPQERGGEKGENKREVSYAKEAGLPFPAEGYRGQYLVEALHLLLAGEEELKEEELKKEELKSEKGQLELSAKRLQELIALSQKENVEPNFLEQKDLVLQSRRLGSALMDHFIVSHRETLRKFRVSFDNFFRESDLHREESLGNIEKLLAGYTRYERGRLIFASSRLGDDKDRVLVREDKRPTYLLADIAYHHDKIQRGFNYIVNIFGPDHHGYIARLKAALQALQYDGQFQPLIVQQVNLLEEGRPIRMSKRSGKLISMQELLEEIPVDVSRYFFIMRSFGAHLDFDMTAARNSSDKNPYYYVAYAHARICSIFRKLKERGLQGSVIDRIEADNFGSLPITPERERLLFYIARFAEEVYDAAIHFAPHRLLAYLYHLAVALAQFYGPKENRIVEQEAELAGQLSALLKGVAICLKNGLALLGMEAPQKL